MGYMDFSGLRYYDGREIHKYVTQIKPSENLLESDSLFRLDAQTLEKGNIDAA